MRLRMLGPLRVRSGPRWVPVQAEQQRVVLAVLLAEAGHEVATERLVDAVWGERPPRRAVNTVHAYVMRLRRLLGDGVLVTRGRGYELVVGRDDVDAAVFERLAASGRRELDAGRLASGASRLARALALWRGPVFADVPPSPVLAGRVAHLEQLLLAGQENHKAALLDMGEHATVVDELLQLVDESPLRERRWALLMRALNACGRRAEALAAYQRARRELREELGLEPGPELRELQQAILAEQARPAAARAPVVVPAQLPAEVPAFTGRDEPLKQLDTVLAAEGGTVVVSAIAGTAGVGKTALAVHWAHRVRDRFTDGQLYVNLRGYASGQPVRPVEALARFLRALGMPPEQVPSDVEEAGALYRSMLAGKRVLVLLDNARDPDQVRPLLPAGPGCLTLVTSRERLGGLVARDGAVPLSLEVLNGGESHELLARLLGADLVSAEPAAASELVRLCAGLPLALRIAAANLSARPQSTIGEYVRRLREDRLGGLDTGDDGVRAAFSLSYQAQPAGVRRLFRLLGLVPGPDITGPAAAALADCRPADADAQLARLAAAHLVDEHAPDRYTVHDLLRRYAAEQATVEESPSRPAAALDRLYRYYQRHVDAAADVLYPEYLRLPSPADPDPARFGDVAAASAWLDAEQSNLVATVVHTAGHGPHPVAWRLADALRGYLLLRSSTVEWQLVAEAALAAAEADGDPRAVAAAHLSLAQLDAARGDYRMAIDRYKRVVDYAEQAGWPMGVATALGNVGSRYQVMGRLEVAAEYLARSLAMRRQLGWRAGEATMLSALGLVYWGLGRLELSARHSAQAADIYREVGATVAQARVSSDLGRAYHGLGRLDDAEATLSSALAVLRDAGDRGYVGYTECDLAQVYTDLGDRGRALALAEAAYATAREVDDRSLRSSALAALAGIHHDSGDHRRAIDGLEQARVLARDVGERHLEVDVMIRLASAYRGAGQLDTAVAAAEQAVARARDDGYRMLAGQALTVLAELRRDLGQLELAQDLAGQAIQIQNETGHRPGRERAEAVAGRPVAPDDSAMTWQ